MFDLIFWPFLGTIFLARLACAVLATLADDMHHTEEE